MEMKIAMKGPLKYVQEAGILDKLGIYTAALGKKTLVVVSPGNRRRMGDEIGRSLEKGGCEFVFLDFMGKVTEAEVERVASISSLERCDVILGVGGGRALDTARAAADIADKKLIIMPTAASNDAPCSAVAILYNDEGEVIQIREVRRNPDLVLVDTAIVARAPVRLLASGMGDALATWYEARACNRSGAVTHAGARCGRTALALAKLCYDTLIELGCDAMDAVERCEINDALEEVVHATIYLSGIGFENGGVAACHAINDGFTAIPDSKHLLHGELVGFGVLVQLELENAPSEEKKNVRDFMRRVKLPMSFEQMGMDGLPGEKLRIVAESACGVPPMKNMPFLVTADDVRGAILAADAASRSYINREGNHAQHS
jgi:glycerol dehydrogenase